MEWKKDKGIIWGSSQGVTISHKIAGFDLDGTLIDTKSGWNFAKNDDDWDWWHPNVPKKLKKLHKNGYRVVIFSN